MELALREALSSAMSSLCFPNACHGFQVQSISKSVPIHYGFVKILKGILLTLKKKEGRQPPKIQFSNQSGQCLIYLHVQDTDRPKTC